MKNNIPTLFRLIFRGILVLGMASELYAQIAIPAPIPNPVGIPDPALMGTNLTGHPMGSGPVEFPVSNPSNLSLFTNFPVYTGQPIQFDGAIHAPIPSSDNTPLPDPTVIYEGNDIGWTTMVLSESSSQKSPTRIAAWTTNNTFRLSVDRETDLYYIVQANTNPTTTNWIAVATNRAPFTFTDIVASNYPVRFYRAILKP